LLTNPKPNYGQKAQIRPITENDFMKPNPIDAETACKCKAQTHCYNKPVEQIKESQKGRQRQKSLLPTPNKHCLPKSKKID
jgi:hypothetical protein